MSEASHMVAGLGLFDLFCLGLVLLSCLIGGWRGLAFEVISLLAWAGAFLPRSGAAFWWMRFGLGNGWQTMAKRAIC